MHMLRTSALVLLCLSALVGCSGGRHGAGATLPSAAQRAARTTRLSADGVPLRIKGYTQRFCLPAFHPSPCYHGYTPGVTAEQVAQWADYVETFGSSADVSALRSAGVPHVLTYVDPFAQVAGGSNVPDDRGNPSDAMGSSGPYTYWNITQADTVAYEVSAITSAVTTLGATGIMSDSTAIAYDGYGSFSPCCAALTSLAQAESATIDLWTRLGGIEIVANGLSLAPDDGRTDPIQQYLVKTGPLIGGVFELCYLSDSRPYLNGKAIDGQWVSTANSALETQNDGKDFICLPLPQNGNVSGDRIYAYASLLLTYDPNHTVYWSNIPSSTNTRLFPENGFVPTQPLVAQPSTVASLQRAGVYVREYAACYNRGSLVGPCAIVVNPSSSATHAIPDVTQTYGHTMTVDGDDVFSGGTIGFDGAKPSTLAPASAAILVP